MRTAKYGLTYDDINPKVYSLREILRTLSPMVENAGDLMEMFGLRGGELLTGAEIRQALAVMIPLLIVHRRLRGTRFRSALGSWPWPLRSLGLAALLIALCFAPGDDRAFIYFQF